MGKLRDACRGLVGKAERTILLGEARKSWDYIETDLKISRMGRSTLHSSSSG
jgi:hypothetical protein